jgi:hypothetical protein
MYSGGINGFITGKRRLWREKPGYIVYFCDEFEK